jgi:PadR family transcriptional regulator
MDSSHNLQAATN